MPFTLSHPAAVVPFTRMHLSLSALIVGSLSPDLLYFIRLAPRGSFGHSLPGLFIFCIPASFIVLAVFHHYIKKPVVALLPDYFQQRLWSQTERFSFLPWPHLGILVISVLLGAITHICWDSFTHASGWAVVHLPALQESVTLSVLGTVPVYKLLQHSSTLFGGAILLSWFRRWLGNQPASETAAPMIVRARFRVVSLLLGSSAIIGIGYGAWRALGNEGLEALKMFVGSGVICSLSVLFVLAGVYGAVQHRQGDGAI